MELKKMKPTSPGIRHSIKIKKNLLSKGNTFLKSEIISIKKRSGRSSITGNITVRHKGGGRKKMYRKILKSYENSINLIIAILYDSTRNSFISIIFNPKLKKLNFILTTQNHSVGTVIESGEINSLTKPGIFLGFDKILTGSLVNSITFKKKKFTFSRSAGTFAQIIQKTFTEIKLRLPSGKIILLPSKNGFAAIGIVSNLKQNMIVIGKAGKNRLLGKRPSVRGIAMNPVDHPHGGRTKGGMAPVSPWGKLTKGVPTKKINK
uniref:Ribosomal protein L2 n=2 Tax=Synura synuroidea TaxID=47573 RepID=Q9MG94_9STRA|nr:ribosomal protein L2 [Synura synuroidea]